MSNNLRIALAFLKRYPDSKLFPAVWDGKAHQGKIKWGTESSGDPERVAEWAQRWPDAYFCIHRVQSGLVVLDIDTKNGKRGDLGLTELELDHGDLPPTLTAETPSGGKHYVFSGEAANCIGKLHAGIDIPVMIPVPGSTVRGKGEYRIVGKHPVAAAPEWVTRMAGAPRERNTDRDDAVVDLDKPHHIAEAASYLQVAMPAIEGQGGDTHTYAVACRVRDMGISADTALELMVRLWNPRCQPAWDFDELRIKIENAYRYAQNDGGAMTAEAAFKDVPARTIGRYDADEGPKEWDDYTGDPPEREWVVEDWLPTNEVSSLYGHGGLGKSLIAVQLGYCVSRGLPFLDLPIARPMDVLGVFAEDQDAELHRRREAIVNAVGGKGAAEFRFFMWSRAQRDSTLAAIEAGGVCRKTPFYERVTAELEKMGRGKKLLLLDTLADLFAGSEVDRESANKFIKVVLGSFVRQYNCTVLLLAHPSVAQRSSGLSGSTAWNNAVRNRIVLEAHKHREDYRILTRAKSNYARAGEEINIMYEAGAFKAVNLADVVDEVEETNKNIVMEAIAEQAAKNQPFGTHASSSVNIYDVRILDADSKEMKRDAKKRFINELIREGSVERITGQPRGNGLWPAGGFES